MKTKIVFLVFLIIAIIPQTVSAYLDPGVGSMVWQMLVAVAFAGAFALKMYWMKIKHFFNREKQ